MHLKCPQCGKSVDGGVVSGLSIVCPHCHAKLKLPTSKAKTEIERIEKRKPEVVILPMMTSAEAPELNEEKKEDLREGRAERRESRQHRKEDRATNGIGALGFAIGLTTLIFLFGAGGAHKEFPFYLLLASCFGMPTSLIGLVCSIIGVMRKGRSKIFSLLGIAIGAFIILAGLPAAFMMLKQGP